MVLQLTVVCSDSFKAVQNVIKCHVKAFSVSCFLLLFFEGAQHEDAISCFSRLLDLAPKSGLGHLGLGTKALREGKFKDAIKYLEQG